MLSYLKVHCSLVTYLKVHCSLVTYLKVHYSLVTYLKVYYSLVTYLKVHCSLVTYLKVHCSLVTYLKVHCSLVTYLKVHCSLVTYLKVHCSLVTYRKVYCSLVTVFNKNLTVLIQFLNTVFTDTDCAVNNKSNVFLFLSVAYCENNPSQSSPSHYLNISNCEAFQCTRTYEEPLERLLFSNKISLHLRAIVHSACKEEMIA